MEKHPDDKKPVVEYTAKITLGVGIRLRSISEEDNLQSLKSVLHEPSYKGNATKISDSFHSCGGVSEAKAFLEEIII